MANIQIYQLDNVGSDLDNSAILAADITNPDASERATTPKVTRGVSMQQLEEQMLQTDEYTTALDTTSKTITGAINELNEKTEIEDISFTVASSSLSDVKIKAVRYGNIVMITGYFRTNASIPDGTTIFSGMANPITPSSDGNLYFNLLNETDGTPQRFRINSPYADFKNQGTLASGKTFVGTLTYICQ